MTRTLFRASLGRQRQTVARVDALALTADRAVLRIWRELLRILRHPPPLALAMERVRMLARLLPLFTARRVAIGLEDLARWGHRSSVWSLRKALPETTLRRAVSRRRGLLEAEGELSWLDLLAPFHQRVASDSDLTLASVARLLFPPPSQEEVHRVVYATGWFERLSAGTRLASPDTVAGIVASGMTWGKSQQEIARELQPIVQGVASSAKRLARTEGMRVAGAMQLQAHEQLGDLVVGYQIHATLDANTRPEHRARDGTIYWKHPRVGQLGYDQMPRPPQEADGSTAWNCRCWLTPVLGP